MNDISKTIGWAEKSWNPVVGCLGTCEYCYAHRMAKRFGWDWAPHWVENNFIKPFPKKPSRIFVGSMTDIAYWQPEWMERVLGKIREYPQHTFFFLTKKASTYQWTINGENPNTFPTNCWLGVTLVNNQAVEKEGGYCRTYRQLGYKTFVSIEPMLGEITYLAPKHFNWIIVGAQTGRGEKVIPKWEWVEAIIKQAKELRIPVYLKENLLKAVPGLPRLKEIPQ